MPHAETLIAETAAQLKALQAAYNLAEWQAATDGTPEANQRAQAELMRFLSDPARHAELKRLHANGAAQADPLLFLPGNRQPWPEHVAAATGQALNPDYFVRALEP